MVCGYYHDGLCGDTGRYCPHGDSLRGTVDMLPDVFFLPWVGPNYGKRMHRWGKVMVLGNTNICLYGSRVCGMDGKCPQTRTPACCWRTVTECRKMDHPLLTFVTRMLLGLHVETEIPLPFQQSGWNEIVFANYLSVALSSARACGSMQQYRRSDAAFQQLLQRYRPSLVLYVGGRDLYNRISWDRFDVDEDFTCQDVSLYCHAYLMPEIGYHVLTVWLPYPALFGKVVTPDRWYMAITRMMETRGHHDSYSETGNVTVWE